MQNKILGLIWILIFSFSGFPNWAQEKANPFDLIPRLDKATIQNLETEESGSEIDTIINPFDIIRSVPLSDIENAPYVVNPNVEPILNTNWDRFKFFSIGIILLFLAAMVSLVGSSLNNAIRSFLNDNAFNQFFRESEGRGSITYYLLYFFFFINLGLFLVYVVRYFDLALPWQSPSIQWLMLSFGVMALFLGKHVLLLLVGAIFPVSREINKYIFLIVVFSITVGILLIPSNMLMAYGPPESERIVFYGTLGLIGLIYIFRLLRSLLIANKYLVLHGFHFLLYICSVEIAPVVIVVRLILNQ